MARRIFASAPWFYLGILGLCQPEWYSNLAGLVMLFFSVVPWMSDDDKHPWKL